MDIQVCPAKRKICKPPRISKHIHEHLSMTTGEKKLVWKKIQIINSCLVDYRPLSL